MGEQPTEDLVPRVIDQIILPAALPHPPTSSENNSRGETSDRTPRPNRSTPRSSGGSLHLGWALVLISVAQLMVVLDGTIVNIALPYIQEDLDIASANLTWVVTGYALAFGSLLLLGGRLGDLYGRRKIFMIGLAIFAVASGLGGLANTEATLLAARALQGLGAALASPGRPGADHHDVPGRTGAQPRVRGVRRDVRRRRGGRPAARRLAHRPVPQHRRARHRRLAPDAADQRARSASPRPRLAPRFLRESEAHRPASSTSPAPSSAPSVSSASSTASAVPVPTAGPTSGRSPAWSPACVLLVAFVLVESRSEDPLLPFRVFMQPHPRGVSYAAMFLAPAAMFAMFYFLSQYIQNVMGYSPIEAGVAFLPFCAGIVVAAGLASNLVNRIDPRFIGGVGTLMAAAGLFGFSRLPYDTTFPVEAVTGSYVSDLLPYILLMSLGMGVTFVPLTLTAVHHLRAEDSGIGSGVLNTMQQVGGAHRPGHPGQRGHRRRSDQPNRSAEAPGAGGRRARCSRQPADLHRGRDQRVPGRLDHDAARLGRDLDPPQRQARGAGHRRPRGCARRGLTHADRRLLPMWRSSRSRFRPARPPTP